MCDHTYCYTPTVRRIRELIRGGEIGEIQFVDSVRINLGLVQPDVDVLWDLAPHDLSILDFVLPADVVPVAVAAHTGDPIGAGRACLAYLSVWLSNGRSRARACQLAQPDEDPDDGLRRVTAHHRLGRHEPVGPAHAPRSRRRPGAWRLARHPTTAGRPSSPTGSGTFMSQPCPNGRRCCRVMTEFAGCDHGAPPAADRCAVRACACSHFSKPHRGARTHGGVKVPVSTGGRQNDQGTALPCHRAVRAPSARPSWTSSSRPAPPRSSSSTTSSGAGGRTSPGRSARGPSGSSRATSGTARW